MMIEGFYGLLLILLGYADFVEFLVYYGSSRECLYNVDQRWATHVPQHTSMSSKCVLVMAYSQGMPRLKTG
jgi:hypothetical protein